MRWSSDTDVIGLEGPAARGVAVESIDSGGVPLLGRIVSA